MEWLSTMWGRFEAKLRDDLKTYGLEAFVILFIWAYFFFFWLPGHASAASVIGAVLVALTPFILPVMLYILNKDARWEYVWQKKYASTEFCVLEVRLPEEIKQSPYAMELMLRGIYQTGVQTPYHAWMGDTPPWFSLEMASIEGRVHFYIWTRKRYKTFVEGQIYAHYPTVQVVEVPDYTLRMPLDPAAVTVAGVEFELQKADPYPIVTYVEVGLDKQEAKEEFKHDPLASVIEFLGSMKEGENMWVQILIRAHNEDMPCPRAPEYKKDGSKKWQRKGRHMTFADWADVEVNAINEKAKKKIKIDGKEEETTDFFKLTTVDRDQQKAIQLKMNKQIFEVGIRTLYIAKKEKAVAPAVIGMASIFRSFEHGSSGRGLNGLRPVFWIGPFNVPWHDFMDIRKHMLWKRYYEAYITRQYFYPPHKRNYIILNSEEIASLYHFPGQVVRTPTLQRLPSRRGEAPSNLPV